MQWSTTPTLPSTTSRSLPKAPVEITSANPNFRGINGYVEGLVGNYTDLQSDGAANLPISDTGPRRSGG